LSENDPANKESDPRDQSERNKDSGFRIDRLSGLYLPLGYDKQRESGARGTERFGRPPFFVRLYRSWWVVILEAIALLISIATVAGVWYYAYWAKIQAGATVTAANATAAQAVVADEAMRISNRPYVEVSTQNGTIAQWIYDSKGTKTGLMVFFENFGITPASQMLVNGCFIYDGATLDCLQKWVHIEPARTNSKNRGRRK
jgi:hypothetical protein